MKYIYTDGNNKDFAYLCERLDMSLNEIVGGEANREEYIEHNRLDSIHDVIIAYDADVPIACASFKEIDEGVVEVKRVFVEKSHRGLGLSKQLMAKLETVAKEKGHKQAVLETGRIMPVAQRLYQSLGYAIIPNYGQYKGMKKSICFGKML